MSAPRRHAASGAADVYMPAGRSEPHMRAAYGHVWKTPRPAAAEHRVPAALFLDAAGTFLLPAENVPDVYLRYARPHGVRRNAEDVLQAFRAAYNAPWEGPLRFVGSGEDFWRRVVFESLGTDNESIFQAVYEYYARPEAWRLPPLLRESVRRIRAAGVPVAVISNFDDRLRPIMEAMAIDDLFDAVLVSSEVGAEKPSPRIFDAACEAVGVDPSEQFVVHVGDDRRNDVWGARQRGIQGWLWGEDVASFEEIADRVVTGHTTV